MDDLWLCVFILEFSPPYPILAKVLPNWLKSHLPLTPLHCRQVEVRCDFNQIQVTPVTQYNKLGEGMSVTSRDNYWSALLFSDISSLDFFYCKISKLKVTYIYVH